MQVIPVEAVGRQPSDAGHAQQALAGMITAMGEDAFGQQALAQLNRWMPLCWWSIYTVHEQLPPTLHLRGSYGVPDGTLDSWAVYRASLYRKDETFHQARDVTPPGQCALVHWAAREIPPPHRAQIYSRHALRERLSVVTKTPGDGLLAVNLYRKDAQPAFSDAAIDAVRSMAPALIACVQRHVAMRRGEGEAAEKSPLQQLPRREREVCDRLLKGWTQDGIAADLGLTPGTVKTYRNRAFERLNIHSRYELFALVTSPTGRQAV